MTTVDPEAEVEFAEAGNELTVFVPVTERPGPWLREYNGLARASSVLAEADEVPGQVRLKVKVARSAGRDVIFAALDQSLELVEKAKAEAEAEAVHSRDARHHVEDWLEARRPG
ncbi:MAG: hypothetical protein M0Z46_03865 [Actinomycetota bacterium]|jgi:hypothetical protein|nr:hypothetical protein [Actinomycetota bacterium]MDA8314038.1 hypothetical protein [Actinomycetota bacterium]